MEKGQFARYINEPYLLNAESKTVLESQVKEFPYCQSLQLLYTKNLHLLNSTRYNSQLKIAAAYSGDRRMLYELMKRTAPVQVKEEVVLEEKKIEEPVVLAKKTDPVIEEKKIAEEKKTEPVVEQKKAEVIKKDRTPEDILRDALAEIDARKKEIEAEKKAGNNTGDQEIVEEKKELEVEQKAKEELKAEEKEIEEIKLEEKGQAENILKLISETTDTPLNETFDEVEKLKEELGTLDELYTNKAIEASVELDIFKAEEELNKKIGSDLKKSIEEENTKKAEGKETVDLTKKHSFSDWLKLRNAGENSEKSSGSNEESSDLIEKFIQTEPKIGKIKTEFYNPVNMARQSVSDSGELVSETLARIYEQQGAYAKAIHAYEILSLRMPEKKSIFAARIEEIRKLIN
jgi:hypothetical protein